MNQPRPANHDRVLLALRARAVWLGVCVLAGAVAQLAAIPIGVIVGRVIDASSAGPSAAREALAWGAGAIAALALLRAACKWWRVALGERIAQGVLAETRLRMFAHLHRLPLRKLARREPGRSVVRFAGDAMSLRSWVAGTLVDTPADLLLIVGALVALGLVHPYLLLAVAVPLLLCVPLVVFVNPRIAQRTREARREQSELAAQVVGSLRDAPEVRRNGQTARARRTALRALQRARGSTEARSRLEGLLDAGVLAATSLGLGGIAAVGAWLLANDAVSAGQLVTGAWLTGLLGTPAARLARANILHTRARVARERIAALFAQRTEQPGSTGGRSGLAQITRLRLNGVALRLPGGGATGVLDHTIRGPGLVVLRASPDASDALFRALRRQEEPAQGKIGINRRRLARYPRRELREAIRRADADDLVRVPRSCQVLFVEIPAGLAEQRASEILGAARAASSSRIVLIACPDPLPIIGAEPVETWLVHADACPACRP